NPPPFPGRRTTNAGAPLRTVAPACRARRAGAAPATGPLGGPLGPARGGVAHPARAGRTGRPTAHGRPRGPHSPSVSPRTSSICAWLRSSDPLAAIIRLVVISTSSRSSGSSRGTSNVESDMLTPPSCRLRRGHRPAPASPAPAADALHYSAPLQRGP